MQKITKKHLVQFNRYVTNINQMKNDLWEAVEEQKFEKAAAIRFLICQEQDEYKKFLLSLSDK